MVEAFFRAAKI